MNASSCRLALAQIAPWVGCRAGAPHALAEMARLNEAEAGCFVLLLSGRSARLLEKPGHFPPEEIAGTRKPSNNLLARAHHYRRMFEAALQEAPFEAEVRLAFSVHDLVVEQAIPVFSFQKRRGSRLILLPDIDFLRHRFYADAAFTDVVPFAAKQDRALFVGSTSGGGTLTAEAVRALRAPRLRAAMHFRGSPRVDFWLPRIVRAQDEAAAEAIAALGVAGRKLDWAEAAAYRYLISMDGNGATCSRVALALRGNGVLLKYASPHLLHYFEHLIPWVHYIPIQADEDVARVMDICAATPGLAESIAQAGGDFYRTHLEQPALLDYTRALVAAYQTWCWRT